MATQGLKGGQWKVLTDDQIHQVHLATLEILNEVGINMQNRKGLEIMADSGCKVDFEKEIVRVPEHALAKALQSAPSQITLYGKSSEFDVVLNDTDTVYTMGGAGAIWVLDLDGNRRPSTLKDLENLTRLQDVLENMHIAHFLVTPQDIAQKGVYHTVFATMLKHTQRPHHSVPCGASGVKAHIEMAGVIAGGTREVMERPFYLENPCVHSPLMQVGEMVEEVLELARYRIPMLIESDALAGGTSPFTIAGTLVETNANILCAIALTQMANPGAPCIYSSSSGIMDMRIGNLAAAAPESTLLHLAQTQMAHFYHLPFQGGNTCDSKIPDAQMGYERASHFLALALGGCNIIHVATGNLEQMRLASYEQCLIDNEILGATFRIVRGMEINRDTLGIDVLKEVGHGGHFLDKDHTLRYLEKARWTPTKLTNRANWESWEADGARDMRQRANEEARKILKEHHPEYITREAEAEIFKIAQEAQKAGEAIDNQS